MKSWLLLALIAGAVFGGIALDKWFWCRDRKARMEGPYTNVIGGGINNVIAVPDRRH